MDESSARLADLRQTLEHALNPTPAVLPFPVVQPAAVSPVLETRRVHFVPSPNPSPVAIKDPLIVPAVSPPPVIANENPALMAPVDSIALLQDLETPQGAPSKNKMASVLWVLKSTPFVALLTFLVVLIALAVSKVSIFGVDFLSGDEDSEDQEENKTRVPNWKAILITSAIAASLVLIIPFIIQWRINASAPPAVYIAQAAPQPV
jgi:hypothetical protein